MVWELDIFKCKISYFLSFCNNEINKILFYFYKI